MNLANTSSVLIFVTIALRPSGEPGFGQTYLVAEIAPRFTFREVFAFPLVVLFVAINDYLSTIESPGSLDGKLFRHQME
jgi:hypothetical protein